MKNTFLFSVLLFLLSCGYNEKPIVKNYAIDVTAYRINSDTINYDSKYDMHISVKSSYGDTIKYVYYNEGLTDYVDTLTIYKRDSLVLRNQLKLMSEKNISFNGKSVRVKKYRQSADPMGPFGNVYINDSMGILLTRYVAHPAGENVIMYNTSQFLALHKAIVNDSVFFKSNYD